jgi:hypothetical protein
MPAVSRNSSSVSFCRLVDHSFYRLEIRIRAGSNHSAFLLDGIQWFLPLSLAQRPRLARHHRSRPTFVPFTGTSHQYIVLAESKFRKTVPSHEVDAVPEPLKSLSEIANIYEKWANANEATAEELLACLDSLAGDVQQQQRWRAAQLVAEAAALKIRAKELRTPSVDQRSD